MPCQVLGDSTVLWAKQGNSQNISQQSRFFSDNTHKYLRWDSLEEAGNSEIFPLGTSQTSQASSLGQVQDEPPG